MLRLINSVLVLCVLAAGFTLYSLEHKTRQLERQIAAVEKEIRQERELMRLLDAEWSLLTRPQRLEELARSHLNMGPVMPDQIVSVHDMSQHIPPLVETQADQRQQERDPMAELLRIMQ